MARKPISLDPLTAAGAPAYPAAPRRGFADVVDRALDLALAIPMCLVLLPLFALSGIAIKLDSRGPVFFTQTRRGRGFAPFTIVKFRSLHHGRPDPHERYEMLAGDSRITRVGRWLRATSIDELPQLFNVLIGTMRMVGPRPLVEWESRDALARFPERFDVKPGITGWSQIMVRNAVGFDERCELDVDYVWRRSLGLDLLILARTPFAMLRGDDVYPDA